jgi:hypothetical protein
MSAAQTYKRLLTPRNAASPPPPQTLADDIERKVLEIIAHFSREGYGLPTFTRAGAEEAGTPLSERELIYLVSSSARDCSWGAQLASDVTKLTVVTRWYHQIPTWSVPSLTIGMNLLDADSVAAKGDVSLAIARMEKTLLWRRTENIEDIQAMADDCKAQVSHRLLQSVGLRLRIR